MASDRGSERNPAVFPVGIVGHDLHEEERELAVGELPPWPPNAELKVVGKPTLRVDALAKVTGSARFTFDVRLRGTPAHRIVVTIPHGRIPVHRHPGRRNASPG